MRTLTEKEFLLRAVEFGIALDPEYKFRVLRFIPDDGDSRFWEIPDQPQRRPFLISALLGLMGEWESCFAWRHEGRWPDSAEPDRPDDLVDLRILNGLGLPLGTTDVAEFLPDELDSLITLLFSTTIFGWSVGEDLYVVPSTGNYMLKTDHHGVVHFEFRDPEEADRIVAQMEKKGFKLPDSLSDPTFKQPHWIETKTK